MGVTFHHKTPSPNGHQLQQEPAIEPTIAYWPAVPPTVVQEEVGRGGPWSFLSRSRLQAAPLKRRSDQLVGAEGAAVEGFAEKSKEFAAPMAQLLKFDAPGLTPER